MKPYLLSLAAGLVFGVLYNLSGVKSPAPPLIALLGLLGMLVGEQVPTLLKQGWASRAKPQVESQSQPEGAHDTPDRPHSLGQDD